MKIRYFLLLILFYCSATTQGQTYWKDTGPVQFPTNISGQIHGIGRVTQIKFSPVHSNRMYGCSSSGGLWISNDGGLTWKVTGTDTLPALNTSAICIDYTNDNILYLSSGDPNYYYENFGIWKSLDGGSSWALANIGIGNRMALELLMSPLDHSTLIAATDDGIWKTTDGGLTWTEKKNGGQFTDMKFKTAPNSATMFACTMDQLWRSVDMGNTWVQVTNGITMPVDSVYSGCRLAVTAADSNRVYFMTNKDQGTVWKSIDGGNSFIQVYHNPAVSLTGYDQNGGGQGNYNFCFTAHPDSPDVVYTASHCIWRSADGGTTWARLTDWYDKVHTDMHYYNFDPINHNKLFNSNDGGVWYSLDCGNDWSESSDGLAATEIYHAGQSVLKTELVSIGTQDNGELMFKDSAWYCNRGGDWGSKSDFSYASAGMVYYDGTGNRRDLLTGTGETNYNLPFTADGNTLLSFTPFNSAVAFASENEVYRTRNLPADTPVWIQLTSINRNIMALATSPVDSNRLYFITNNGRFYRSTNAFATTPSFTNIALPFTPSNRASIAPVTATVVYIAIDNKVYRGINNGSAWADITYNLPNLNHIRVVYDTYSNDESVYVAMGASVYYKNVSMTTWQNVSQGLPTVADIQDLIIFNDGTACSKLRVAYYGRGVFERPINPNRAPFATVGADITRICPDNYIHYSYGVCGNVDSIQWQFTGGTPAISHIANPVVYYTNPGTYPATLVVSNIYGNDTSIINIVVTGTYPVPLAEGFELPAFPPVNWKLAGPSGDNLQWNRVTNASGYGNSAASILFDNYNHDTQGNRNQLWTPRLNFDSLISARLTFDLAYAPWGGGCAYPDSLDILVSTDCGVTQTMLYAKKCDTLATTANIQDSLFVPNAGQWRTDTVNLNAYAGMSDVMVIIENVGHYGQGIYLDNINILGIKQQPPAIAFTANKQTICAGDSIQFTDQSTNQPDSWNWIFTGGSPVNSLLQNPVVKYDSAGTYSVALTAANIVGGNTSTQNGFITVNPLPVQPVITQNGGSLYAQSSSSGTYQWYLNGNLIAGAIASSYTPTQPGSYSVTLTSAGGCVSNSPNLNFVFTAVSGIDNNFISVTPNPNEGIFTLSVELDGVYDIEITDATGREIFSQSLLQPGRWVKDFDFQALSKGVYFVSIFNGHNSFMKKVVVE